MEASFDRWSSGFEEVSTISRSEIWSSGARRSEGRRVVGRTGTGRALNCSWQAWGVGGGVGGGGWLFHVWVSVRACAAALECRGRWRVLLRTQVVNAGGGRGNC